MTKYCTPEIDTSEIIVDFQGVFQWIVSGMFQHNFTLQLYAPKNCHFPSGFLLEFPSGHSPELHTCHILPPSEIDCGLCLVVFTGSEER